MSTSPTSKLSWKSYEHTHKEDKSQDWFWALGFVALSVAVAAILLHNTLFGLLILLAALVLGLSANKEPQENAYSITTRGITINDKLYPYKTLEAFWIDETRPNRTLLIIDAQKPFMPHLIIDVSDEIDVDELQDYLLDYLPEEELFESPAHRIAEMFGF
jgi:hypothetical protein